MATATSSRRYAAQGPPPVDTISRASIAGHVRQRYPPPRAHCVTPIGLLGKDAVRWIGHMSPSVLPGSANADELPKEKILQRQ